MADELSKVVSESHVWRGTLAARPDDCYAEARERLRTAFVVFRQRAGLLAGEIRTALRQLTLHDLTHIDALWETASTILGKDYCLTPTEGFALGGAFLLHDLGMAMAAVEGGSAGLKADPRWADLLTYEYMTTFDRAPSSDELEKPDEGIYNRVLLSLLQQTHADNAERLVFMAFRPKPDSDPIHLIDDPELRQSFGRVIGRVAHSHWWNLSELEKQFQRTVGAPHWCPRDWTVDPLKVACVLRCADAAQIDARRAPIFLKALSELQGSSADHWAFQEKLNKPYLAEDALVFTTGHAFSISEASAWWLCLESLRMVDRELGSVDALFADKGSQRFAARRVAGIEEPERLVSYIQTDGWLPINAMIHVTDLPRVIRSVGGEELYGKHPEVALRELIQNASDAIHARRIYERRSQDYGSVTVSLNKSGEGGYWLEVCDNGIGMSRYVLTNFLLDFGRPFWGSVEMQREFPGLLSSGLKQIGKYGIGFFSVFMLAENVQVITRRSDAAARDTLVLQFSRGLKGRPNLRAADTEEQLVDGGTRVRLKLQTDPFMPGGFLRSPSRDETRDLADVCVALCPALEVDLFVNQDGNRRRLVAGGDWRTIDSYEFLKRMRVSNLYDQGRPDDIEALRQRAAKNLRFLRDAKGEIVGRALVTAGFGHHGHLDLSGVVAIGGLEACSLSGIAGMLTGVPLRASRDEAKPVVDTDELKRWAEEQGRLVPALWEDSQCQAACAQYIRLCGGDTGDLPICRNRGRWCSANEIRARTDLPDIIVLLDDFIVEYELKHLESYSINDNVFVVGTSAIPGLLQCGVLWPKDRVTDFSWGGPIMPPTLGGAVVEAIAHAWGVDVKAVIRGSQIEKESDVVIGTTARGELKERAIVICRPKEEDPSNRGLQPTAYSVRSSVVPVSSGG
jgi:hypothetical protein